MSHVVAHCRRQIRTLRGEFLQGKGSGDIYECLILTYLEVIESAEGRDPFTIWEAWQEVIAEESDGGTEPLNRFFGDSEEGRGKLVEVTDQFVSRFHLPSRRAFTVPTAAVDEAEEPPPEEPYGAIGELFGEQCDET